MNEEEEGDSHGPDAQDAVQAGQDGDGHQGTHLSRIRRGGASERCCRFSRTAQTERKVALDEFLPISLVETVLKQKHFNTTNGSKHGASMFTC